MSQKTLFDPIEDLLPKPILLGTFPAHLKGIREGAQVNGAVPYNLTFQLAEEVSDFNGIDWQKELPVDYDPEAEDAEDPRITEAGYLALREVKSIGIWYTPKPKPGEAWRNRRYYQVATSLGLSFPKVKEGKKDLVDIIPFNEFSDDPIGMPVLVTINLQESKKEKEKGRKFPRVFSLQAWEEGKKIDFEEEEESVGEAGEFSLPEEETETSE
jgi:hypothetical protein